MTSRKRGREDKDLVDDLHQQANTPIAHGKCYQADTIVGGQSTLTEGLLTHGGTTLNLAGRLPKLVVLDLDKTLWPFYCHEQTTGPYHRYGEHKDAVKCRTLQGTEKVVRLFPGVLDILRCLNKQDSIRLAVASRSPVETPAKGILGALGMLDLFCCLEIHRGSKATHFKHIAEVTGVPYRDMLFFDDDDSNIKVVSRLGACCFRVSKESGLTTMAVQSGLKRYREACLSRSAMKAWLQPTQIKP